MPSRPPIAAVLALLLPVLQFAHLGCAPREEKLPPDSSPAASSPPVDTGNPPVAAMCQPYWEVVYLHDQPVGWQAARLFETEQEGKRLLAGEVQSQITVSRFGQPTSQTTTFRSVQSETGEVVETFEASESGTARSTTHGSRKGQGLLLVTDRGGNTAAAEVALPKPCGGYFAVEWSLRSNPMRAGERRELQAFMPVFHQVTTIALEAGEWRDHADSGHPRVVLPITQTLLLKNSPPMRSEILVDDQGVIWESRLPAIRQRIRRVSESEARAVQKVRLLDLGNATAIGVATPIESPETIARIRYRLTLDNRHQEELFPTTGRQNVKALGPDTLEIEVIHNRPTPVTLATDAPPTQEDSAPSALVQSDDPEIRKLAAEATTKGETTLERVSAIERCVHEAIRDKDYSSALASASEVVRARRGDCTEHAVLTAALCRANGVPARAVIGLLHVPSLHGFVFHMWNEAWLGTHWHPLDSTLPQGHIGAVRLVLSRTPLASDGNEAAFAPVLSVMGQVRIEVLGIARVTNPHPHREPSCPK